ncbi:tyrosine-type recombinase/integrase [Alicyclobacillus cycloheptanicus]|uniref:Integrase/recombinase XerD n=1 Tax=Alicyclobacillus cycloheptanicus TaxID=1457 RepID=A0ABT9XLE6_9BACL|nr:tyrosine-type recombinase/integrase [Alicyclobacillus cycloheptanicus]MDQ0191126.1 integrase/recombinase XerD [Alicyclobacillus cycloheptanicus]WDM01869.1 tyrosine-type recombinase/integrase [Alicyclobacillus cycloheptanicus]
MTRRKNVVRLAMANPPMVNTMPSNEELLVLRLTDMRRERKADDYVKHESENIRAVLKCLPEGTSLLSLSTEELESMVFDNMRARNLKPNTINGRIKSLRRLYATAINHGYTNTNPALGLKMCTRVKEGIDSFDETQLTRLLEQPDLKTFVGLRDHCGMTLMIDTGIRLREMVDLTVSQVDLKARMLRNVKGKNRKVQNIPLSQPMCKILQRYLIERGEVDCDALFVTVDNRPLKRRTFQERMEIYGIKAGIDGIRVSPHTLRHTFAKHWIMSGGDAVSLKDMLRQSTMDQAADYVKFFSYELRTLHDQHSPLVNIHIV